MVPRPFALPREEAPELGAMRVTVIGAVALAVSLVAVIVAGPPTSTCISDKILEIRHWELRIGRPVQRSIWSRIGAEANP